MSYLYYGLYFSLHCISLPLRSLVQFLASYFASTTQPYRKNLNVDNILQSCIQLMLNFCLLKEKTKPLQHSKEVNIPEKYTRLPRKSPVKVKTFKPLACLKEHFPSKQHISIMFTGILWPINMAQCQLHWDWQEL